MTARTTKDFWGLGPAAALLFALPGAVFAADSEEASDTAGVEEVIVTAQRVAESIQDVSHLGYGADRRHHRRPSGHYTVGPADQRLERIVHGDQLR